MPADRTLSPPDGRRPALARSWPSRGLSTSTIGWAAALMVLLLWAGWIVVSRFGVAQDLTIFDIAFLRFSVTVVAVLPLAWRFWPRHLAWWQIAALGCGPGVPYVLLAFAGMTFAPASHAGVLMNGTLPILAAAVGWCWLGDRPDRWKLLGMATILVSALLIAWDRTSVGAGTEAWIGHLCFLGSAALLAAYMVAAKVWRLTPLQALVAVPLANLVWFGPLYLLFLPKGLARAGWPEILLQGLYQGLGPGLLGVLGFTLAIRSIGATTTAAVLAGVPGVAALIAIPTLGEWPSLPAWLGLGLATAGILVTAGWLPRRKSPRHGV